MNWLKYKKIYFMTSLFLLFMSIYSLINWKLNLGVDFTGGTVLEYKFNNLISTEDMTKLIERIDIKVNSIQQAGENIYLFRLESITAEQKSDIDVLLESFVQEPYLELRYENVGPSVGPELVKKTVYAAIIASIAILMWVAYQFNSIKFGVSAILAMFHDSFILMGAFTIFGHFWGAEIDFLFVTALLTTLSFSVHDTIVVFDRIREINKSRAGNLDQVANRALTETMVRSLNNSFTIVFMLVALILLGGTTVKWFAVALLVGTLLGTYSSPFVAVPLLVSWDGIVGWLRKIVHKIR